MSEVHFYASGLSTVVTYRIWVAPKVYFSVFCSSEIHFPGDRFVQYLFLMSGEFMK